MLRNSSQQIQIHSRTGDLHSPMKHQQQQDSMASCSARKRTARRSGKLVKRIVAHASLCLDGLDVLAHFLPGKVGRGTLAIPEGHAGIPVVDHRLGLAELAVPAREWHGAGVSYQSEGARQDAALRRCSTGVCARAGIGAAAWGVGAYSFLLRWLVTSKIGWL